MTRAKVIQLGFLVLILGGLAYSVFSFAGLDSISAGIAAQSILVVVVVGWTGSYLLRVVSGNMTFMQQRRRYQQAYENLSTAELSAGYARKTLRTFHISIKIRSNPLSTIHNAF
mgnify:CR=1 FL=1